MEKCTFKVIADSLRIGHEIEFSYKGKLYGIVNSRDGYWYFCCNEGDFPGAACLYSEELCLFEDEEALIERVSEIRVDSIPIPAIFDEGKYEDYCIL